MSFDTLVLSGASAKCIIFLGALQSLFDNNTLSMSKIENFIGTSSGSIICLLLCIGYTPIEILIYICKNKILDKSPDLNVLNALNGNGMISFSIFQEHLEKMIIEKISYLPTIDDIKKKYNKNIIFTVYNLSENKTEYISIENYPNLPVVTAIRMSCGLPLIFEKFKYNNCFYIDGGISDNFPIDIGEKRGENVLGINTKDKFNESKNTIEYIYNLMFVPIYKNIENKIKNTKENTKIINIEYNDTITFFDFNISSTKKLDLFSFGYDFVKKLT